jgi:hypothetical protein
MLQQFIDNWLTEVGEIVSLTLWSVVLSPSGSFLVLISVRVQ